MERRLSKRTLIRSGVELVSNGNNYTGFIDNLSENGIGVTTAPIESAIDFVPGTMLELKFQLPSGETIALLCEIKWLYSYKLRTFRIANNIGMQIINPPREYKKFIKTLR